MVDLPVSIDTLLDVDAIIVTHTHPDHWDEAAATYPEIDVDLCEMIAMLFRAGFTQLRQLSANSHFEDITLIKTDVYTVQMMPTP
jgi:glyoxylase-like metal-dependent hydrolase (beta-lactamase superfamily II)